MAATQTGRFVWFEYVSKESAKPQRFFAELFGWTAKNVPMPQGAYTMIAAPDGKTIGGYLTPPPGAPEHPHWLAHLQVTSASESAAKVKSLGGKIAMEPFKVGDVGTMAVVRDPLGAAFALWQPTKPEEQPQPGVGHFTWNELSSKDPSASAQFYAQIGGFSVENRDMPGMGTYHLLKSDGQPRAGIMTPMMPNAPHAWLPYVHVASADQTIDKAKRLSATVVVPPTDIPEVGRFAIFSDPIGATLGVLQPKR